jgi:hypothetical protein
LFESNFNRGAIIAALEGPCITEFVCKSPDGREQNERDNPPNRLPISLKISHWFLKKPGLGDS